MSADIVSDLRDAQAALARIRALADEWERTADAIAITYQNADDRSKAIGGHRYAIRKIREALDGDL